MAKLVAIGDSLSQGFSSGAILRTDWSYPAMIARAMGLSVPGEFRVPRVPKLGLPLDLEDLLRTISSAVGHSIEPREWAFQLPNQLRRYIDSVEDYYERGPGSLERPSSFRGHYHNLSNFGFRVVDSFAIDSAYCEKEIDQSEGWIEDDFLGLPSAPLYRSAHRILNPGNRWDGSKLTQLDNLQKIYEQEGVENLIIFLGANDCLGTVFSLQLKRMPEGLETDDPQERREYNLTSPSVFRRDYETMVSKVSAAIGPETNVFIGTVPYVTIPPITRGLEPYSDGYFEYYGRFFAQQDTFNPRLHQHLTREQVVDIDRTIDEFNQIIRDIVSRQGNNWHIVDVGNLLNSLAVKRNDMQGTPDGPLRAFLSSRGVEEHPLFHLDPIPSVLLLKTKHDNENQPDRVYSKRMQGGFFSLDCIHPTTIGYGLLAEEFLRVMQEVGVSDADPSRLDWAHTIANDSLLQIPPLLWDDIISAAENNYRLLDVVFRILGR